MSPGESPIKILILAASPQGSDRGRLDEEVRDIEEGLRRSQERDRFEIIARWAVRPRDVQRALLDINPTIVHFAGQGGNTKEGEDEGLIFENEIGEPQRVEGSALASLFNLFSESITCVLLNGCYSQTQAVAIAEYIPNVVGMKQALSDRAAIEFAVGFYDALGAGRSVKFAYQLGCSAIRLAGTPEHLAPVLLSSADDVIAADPIIELGSTDNSGNLQKPDLTSGERQRLTIEKQEIQSQLDTLNEEIEFLQQSNSTEDLAPKSRFRLQKQIEAAKAKRQTLSEEMVKMERKLQ